jgi:surfactin synthase thioesterase subunit
LALALPEGVEVLSAQYPGRQERYAEAPVEDLAKMGEHIVRALGSREPVPTVFFGHSMGATLAFHVAQVLEGAGSEGDGRGPLGLFVSARRAPSRSSDRQVHLLSDADLVAELRKLSETGNPLLDDPEFVEMILPAVRGDYRALEGYRPRPGARVACSVVALRGDADPRVRGDEVEAWAAHTSSTFDLRVFSGGHFYLERHTSAVADLVSTFTTRWRQG